MDTNNLRFLLLFSSSSQFQKLEKELLIVFTRPFSVGVTRDFSIPEDLIGSLNLMAKVGQSLGSILNIILVSFDAGRNVVFFLLLNRAIVYL